MKQETYEIKNTFYRLDRNIPMTIYRPVEKTAKSEIAVLAMHGLDYMSFPPMVEMARRGFTAASATPGRSNRIEDKMLDVKTAVVHLMKTPGIKKVVLMGHSNGGCLFSCYQYIAENGTSRFKSTERIMPFPDIESLPAADGLMLLDANYGIMDMLAMDPAVKNFENGFERIPELDIYNPENGYHPEGSRYTQEFIVKFQRAQVKFYKDILAYALQRHEEIKAGRGRFLDDEPLVIPGAGGGSDANKLFIQDNSLLSHTRKEYPLLRKDGIVTNEIIFTNRITNDAPRPELYHRGSLSTTVNALLMWELKFDDDFGYDKCSMWGSDWDFNPYSTRANVKGISVPLFVEGNTASHEFIQAEYNYELAKSKDKSIVFLHGADHVFRPQKATEAYPGEYGDTLTRISDYMAAWLSEPGRFLG